MEQNSKLQIYKGMIQYLMKSTNYTLKNIADLTDTSIKNIRSIYLGNLLPPYFSSELQLIKLYQMILECQKSKKIYINHVDFSNI